MSTHVTVAAMCVCEQDRARKAGKIKALTQQLSPRPIEPRTLQNALAALLEGTEMLRMFAKKLCYGVGSVYEVVRENKQAKKRLCLTALACTPAASQSPAKYMSLLRSITAPSVASLQSI